MSMLESFFSVDKEQDHSVFDGLNIMKHSEFCSAYMNQYPVLFISLKNVEGRNFELAFEKMKDAVADFCKKHMELEPSECIDHADAEIFHRLLYKTEIEEEVQNALKILMSMMHAVYSKPVVLLIDEYDVPLAKAKSNGYYRDMLDVIRGIMNALLKTNDDLKTSVITGCLRIPKESIFTGVNNFASYSVLDGRFSRYFGFTETEVDKLLQEFGLFEKADIIKDWYDGYQTGNTQIYCPWDVSSYVSDLPYDPDTPPQNYWENTSSNDAINSFFELPDAYYADEFEALMNGQTIHETVTTALTYDHAYELPKNLWSILLMTGYITISSE